MGVELVVLSGVVYRGEEITRPRIRNLLALLAGDLRTGVSTARLVEGLWPEERPDSPAKALQVLVSHARAQLGSAVIASTPVGYRLALGADQVDASAVLLRAAASARASRAGDHAAALEHAEAGLALWDGPASWDGVPADPLSALRAERASTYRLLARARTLALARVGRGAEVVEALTEMSRERPRDEEVLVELLRSEAVTAGPAAALARYEAYRRGLREELGSDPGAAVQEVHQQLLQGQAPPVRHGIPHEPNRLLGRDDDITAVGGLLRSSRVTSIVGAGGLGKTRLAHAVSRRAEQRVVHLVALAGVTADADVPGEVASALGVGEIGRTPAGRLAVSADVLTGIVNALGPGPALLVLDNCEHVLDGVAELVRGLVSMSKDLRVLTTSRAPLGLSSEAVYPLPELSLATAVELFEQRARAARPDVALPADVVGELCGRLDGLPLAVELAAARVRVMSVPEIADRLADRFSLLRGGNRDTPRRHRTLHAVIDWSWHLLDPTGRAAMRALSVLPGGFTADAAWHQVEGADVLEVLAQLVEQSLLKVADTASGTRFRMLETVREFSAARREEADETAAATDRFLAWARDFGVAHHESLFGADLVTAAERIRAEQDNLVQALRHGLDREDGATVAATAAALAGLWTLESNFTRMAALATETAGVLSRFRPEPALVEATRTAAVLCAVDCLLLLLPHRARFYATLRRLPPAPPDTLPRATAIVLLAVTRAADLPMLRGLCGSEEPLLAGMANGVASYVRESQDDVDGALAAAGRMLTAFEIVDIPWMRAVAHSRIGELCLQLGRGDEAREHILATLPALEQIGARTSLARVRWAMVLANLQCGAVDEAARWLAEAERSGGEDAADVSIFHFGARAEILLARGDVDGGLRSWRRAVEALRTTEHPGFGGAPPELDPLTLETKAVTVIAHARHGRLDLVTDLADELPGTLSRVLADLTAAAPAPYDCLPVNGTLLLALAIVDLDRAERAGDVHARGSVARMIALAERFRFVRGFQPTMSPAHATHTAEQADKSAYTDAVSTYADLTRAELLAAARDQLTARDRG